MQILFDWPKKKQTKKNMELELQYANHKIHNILIVVCGSKKKTKKKLISAHAQTEVSAVSEKENYIDK